MIVQCSTVTTSRRNVSYDCSKIQTQFNSTTDPTQLDSTTDPTQSVAPIEGWGSLPQDSLKCCFISFIDSCSIVYVYAYQALVHFSTWIDFYRGCWYGAFGMTAPKKFPLRHKKFCPPPKKFVNWRYWTQLKSTTDPTHLDSTTDQTQLDSKTNPTQLDSTSDPTQLDSRTDPTQLDSTTDPTQLDSTTDPT